MDKSGVFPPWLLKLRAKLFRGDSTEFVDANRNRLGMPVSDIRRLYGEEDLGDKSLLDHIQVKRKRRVPKATKRPRITVSKKTGRGITKRKYRARAPKTSGRYNIEGDMDPFMDFGGYTSTQQSQQDTLSDSQNNTPDLMQPTHQPQPDILPQDLDETIPYGEDETRENTEWVDEIVYPYEIKENVQEITPNKIPPIILKKKRLRKKNSKYYGEQFCE